MSLSPPMRWGVRGSLRPDKMEKSVKQTAKGKSKMNDYSTEQLTFSEKIIEADMLKFKETGNIKYYKSAKTISEQDNSPYIFVSMKKQLSEEPLLSLKMELSDGSYWKCLQLLASTDFELFYVIETLIYINKKTDDEEFKLLYDTAQEKLFKYMFIGANDVEPNLEKIKERNQFIQIALSYFKLKRLKTKTQIELWEKELEGTFKNDEALAKAYHKHWKYIEEYYEKKNS